MTSVGRSWWTPTSPCLTHTGSLDACLRFGPVLREYLWAGVPVVTTSGSTLATTIDTAGAGRTVPPGDLRRVGRRARFADLRRRPAPVDGGRRQPRSGSNPRGQWWPLHSSSSAVSATRSRLTVGPSGAGTNAREATPEWRWGGVRQDLRIVSALLKEGGPRRGLGPGRCPSSAGSAARRKDCCADRRRQRLLPSQLCVWGDAAAAAARPRIAEPGPRGPGLHGISRPHAASAVPRGTSRTRPACRFAASSSRPTSTGGTGGTSTTRPCVTTSPAGSTTSGRTWCTCTRSRGSALGCLAAAQEAGAKVVVSMHDFWWFCARQFLADTTITPCCPVVEVGTCSCETTRAVPRLPAHLPRSSARPRRRRARGVCECRTCLRRQRSRSREAARRRERPAESDGRAGYRTERPRAPTSGSSTTEAAIR